MHFEVHATSHWCHDETKAVRHFSCTRPMTTRMFPCIAAATNLRRRLDSTLHVGSHKSGEIDVDLTLKVMPTPKLSLHRSCNEEQTCDQRMVVTLVSNDTDKPVSTVWLPVPVVTKVCTGTSTGAVCYKSQCLLKPMSASLKSTQIYPVFNTPIRRQTICSLSTQT